MSSKSCLCCGSEDVTAFSESSFLRTPVLQCGNCRFTFNDTTDEAAVSAFLEDYYSGDYWQVNRERTVNRLLKKLLEITRLAGIRPIRFAYQRAVSQLKYSGMTSGKALDIGAGRGALSLLLASRGFATSAVEPDPKNVQRLNSANPAIAAFNCPFDQLQTDATFDAVFASHVLEHDLHPVDFMATLKSLLSPNGRAFIEVPNADNPAALDFSVHHEPHVTHFSRRSIEHLFTRLGFDIIKIDSVSYGFRNSTLDQIVSTLKFLLFDTDIYCNAPDTEGDAYRVLIKPGVAPAS